MVWKYCGTEEEEACLLPRYEAFAKLAAVATSTRDERILSCVARTRALKRDLRTDVTERDKKKLWQEGLAHFCILLRAVPVLPTCPLRELYEEGMDQLWEQICERCGACLSA